MTTLVVRPINLSESGSYRERQRYLRLLRRIRLSDQSADEMLAVMDEADALLTKRLTTDDGSPVEDALDRISAQDFDSLLSAIAFESGVGEASTVPSDAGQEGTVPSTQNG